MVLKNKVEHKSLKKVLPKSSADLVDVLELLFQFNPYMRPTAKELLKHSLFNDVRIEEN